MCLPVMCGLHYGWRVRHFNNALAVKDHPWVSDQAQQANKQKKSSVCKSLESTLLKLIHGRWFKEMDNGPTV